MPNERVIALFHHFFLQFLHIVEIDQKAQNITTLRPPVPCILQILTTFNLYSGRPRVGLSVNNKQKVRQAMDKISRGGGNPPAPAPLGQTCWLKWLDHQMIKKFKIYSRFKIHSKFKIYSIFKIYSKFKIYSSHSNFKIYSIFKIHSIFKIYSKFKIYSIFKIYSRFKIHSELKIHSDSFQPCSQGFFRSSAIKRQPLPSRYFV